MALYQYYPNDVIIVFGPLVLTGLAKDMVTVRPNADAFTYQVGAYGDGVRSRSNDNSATVTVTLMQGSSSNDELSALHIADRYKPRGIGSLPLMIKDNSGTSMHQAAEAWITNFPEDAYSTEAGTRPWVFLAHAMQHHVGSNR